jgi:hypothetical protein
MPHPLSGFDGLGEMGDPGSFHSMSLRDLGSLLALVCGVLLVLMAA